MMRRLQFKDLLALVVMVGAWIGLGLYLVSFPPKSDTSRHRAAGWGLAREAMSLLGPGGHVFLIARDTTDFPQPAMTALLDSFRRTLAEKNISVGSIRALEVDPLRLVEVPSADFLTILRQAPAGSVVVSLMGPPLLTDDERKLVSGTASRVVAFCPGNIPSQIDLRRLFAQGLLNSAVVIRAGASSTRSGRVQDDFPALFRTINGTNVTSLYDGPRAM